MWLPVTPLLALVCALKPASASLIYPLGFYDMTGTGSDNEDFVSVHACSTKGVDVAFDLELADDSYDRYTCVRAGSRFNVDIPGSVVHAGRTAGSKVVRKELKVRTDSLMSVYGISSSASMGIDGFMVPVLTTDSTAFYVAGALGDTLATSDESGLILAAKYKDTTVKVFEVVSGSNNLLYSATIPYFLQMAQVQFDNRDTTGLYVTSNKPINVFSYVRCTKIQVNFCNHVAESIPPVGELGTKYVVPPIDGRSVTAGYIVNVVATRASTTITWTSTGTVSPVAGSTSKERGEFLQLDVTDTDQPALITCSKPCLVMQYNKGRNIGGDFPFGAKTSPFMMLIAATNHFASDACFTTPEHYDGGIVQLDDYLAVVTRTSDTGSIRLDGAAISSAWTAIGSFSVTTTSVAHGWHSLSVTAGSNAEFAAYLYGHSAVANSYAYGYPVTYQINGQRVTDAENNGYCSKRRPGPRKCRKYLHRAKLGNRRRCYYFRGKKKKSTRRKLIRNIKRRLG